VDELVQRLSPVASTIADKTTAESDGQPFMVPSPVLPPDARIFTDEVRYSVLYAAAAPRNGRIEKDALMASTATGTIKRLTDKGFGFIAAPDGVEYFFHQSACQGTRFDDLREGQRVTFEIGQGPKGPRAENVKLA